jgi:Ni,Fe-hydrogenase III large subunit
MDNAVLMEIEKLRLAGLREKFREVFQEEARTRHRQHLFRRIAWRLQALAEGDLTERARVRANEIAQDADLRKVAPRDFFSVGGEGVETTRGDRPKDRRCRERCSAGSGKGGRFWLKSWRTDSGMRTGITHR